MLRVKGLTKKFGKKIANENVNLSLDAGEIGILLGRGFDIDDARSELHGVTLESLVVAERVARAIRIQAANNTVRLSDYPLLMHVDDILHHAPVQIPWDRFTFEQF